MKITKIMTKYGQMQKPVTIELEEAIERIRSGRNQQAAKKIAGEALTSRLIMEKGGPRYSLTDIDLLPCLLFSATFSQKDLERPNGTTGLIMLHMDCPNGAEQIEQLRQQVVRIPYTAACFQSVSGVSLKVIVSCAYSDGFVPKTPQECFDFVRDALVSAFLYYDAVIDCEIDLPAPSLTLGCRMSHDPQAFYNPVPMQLPVVRHHGDVLKPYEGTRTDDEGTIVWRSGQERMERLRLEFQTCLAKAIADVEPAEEGQPMEPAELQEQLLQLLADCCAAGRLPEEACVRRACWTQQLRLLSRDVIRKTFRTAYQKPAKGRPLSQMNEKERIMRSIEDFLSRRYQLRFNTVKQMVEFRQNDLTFTEWQPLTDRQLRSIVVEEMKEGGESWMNDIRTYIESAHVVDYNPIHEFLAGVGEWDGQHNYIEDFARRLNTSYADWPRYYHRWFLAMVAQALNLNRDFGNSMVPLLIGKQGLKKSNFCKNILPPSLREYYMDDIKMENAEQVERVLGRMWLVNIDEYNSKTEREQAKIKRLLTEKDVQVRKMRSDQYTMTPRLCSFIATTNDPTPLPSGDGSRRYLCVEVESLADMSGFIPYKQIFAQAMSELRNPDCIYWFDADAERNIQKHNARYQQVSTQELVLSDYFMPAPENAQKYFWRVSDIQKELRRHLKASDVPNLKNLGLALKKLGWPHGGACGQRGYYLIARKQDK